MKRITHTTPSFKQLVKWQSCDVIAAMFAEEENGGLGFSKATIGELLKLHLRGVTFLRIIEKEIDVRLDSRLSNFQDELVLACKWFKERLDSDDTITVTVSVLDWFSFTSVFEKNSLPSLLDQIVDNINEEFSEEKEKEYQTKVQQEINRINQCLGKIGIQDAEWPVIVYESTPKLDWRFSAHILPSLEETRSVNKIRNGNFPTLYEMNSFNHDHQIEQYPSLFIDKSTLSIHEFIAEEICASNDSSIYVLLALSGAGKSHSLFYLNTSNTAFTLPIDFGSVEDKSVLLYESLDYIRNQVKKLKPNKDMDEEIENENKTIVNNIQAEIATLFSLRGLMLLKLLRKRRKSLTPSMWIRFLYNQGSYQYKSLYCEWKERLRTLNKDAKFLKLLIVELNKEIQGSDTCKSKNIVLTVDEINPLVNLGRGDNMISTHTEETTGSVAYLV